MKFPARIIRFDKENYRLTLDLVYIDEQIISTLEEYEENNKIHTFQIIGVARRNEIFDGQRKRWFQIISHILMHSQIDLTRFNILALHDDFKRTYLPCGYITLGIGDNTKQLAIPMSLARGVENGPTSQQMDEAIKRVENDYMELGIPLIQPIIG